MGRHAIEGESLSHLFAQRAFVRFWLARICGTTANQMLQVLEQLPTAS